MLSYRRFAVIAWLFTTLLPLHSTPVGASLVPARHPQAPCQPVQCATLNVVLLGDSNTWLGGDDCSKPKGWNTWFVRELQPASCHSYARSGATWTNTQQTKRNTEENIGVLGDDNVIYNQICRLTEATDKGEQPLPHLIILMAGTNDAWFCNKRPHAFDAPRMADKETWTPNNVLTLQESVSFGCRLLHTSYPDAQLVLVTPPQTTAVETSLINRTGDIIEQVGNDLSIPVIRLDHEGCIDREQELQQKHFTYDGTHTSEDGARCIGHLIATHITRSIVIPSSR